MAAPLSHGPPHLVQCDIARTWTAAAAAAVAAADPNDSPTSSRLGATLAQSLAQPGRHSTESSQGLSQGGLLPPSNVYLGETYTAQITLSVPAEAAPHIAHQVHLVVEIHSGIPPLVDPNAPPSAQPPPLPSQIRQHAIRKRDQDRLEPGQAVQVPIEWELKELASHAVVCFVSYGVQVQDRETGEPTLVTRQLRKILRFEVLNPLSVRTKAHAPTPLSPTTYLSPTERCKVFLEVQVQNHCDSPMSFSRMRFDPLSGFTVSDEANRGFLVNEMNNKSAPTHNDKADDFLHLPTGSVRQFLYILTITDPALLASALPPGSSQGLGRLDIVWHTARGQRGHLQSATLGRRIPPALASVLGGHSSSTASSRQTGTSPALPPLPPTSTNRGSRPSPSPQRGFDHSLAPPPAAVAAASSSTPTPRTSISSTSAIQAARTAIPGAGEAMLDEFKVDVTVSEVSPVGSACEVGEPVTVRLRVAVRRPRGITATKNLARAADQGGEKALPMPQRIRLVWQHVQWHPSPTLRGACTLPQEGAASSTSAGARRSARPTELAIPGAMPPASGASPSSQQQQQPGVTSLELQQRQAALLAGHRRGLSADVSVDRSYETGTDQDRSGRAWREAPRMHGFRLPRPVPDAGSPVATTASGAPSAAVLRLGTDVVDLGWIDIPGEAQAEGKDDKEADGSAISFEMRFVPLERGLIRFGGLRVLALPPDEEAATASTAEGTEDERDLPVAVSVWEAATIAEVWCE